MLVPALPARRDRRRPRRSGGAVVVVAAAVVALAVGVPAAPAATTISSGHADWAARLVDGRLSTQLRDGRGVWHDPATVVVQVPDGARTTAPTDPRFAFAGAAPGRALWVLPQTERAGIPWLGWGAESVVAPRATGAVAWSLDAVEGPGAVAMWQQDALGDPTPVFASADGLPDVHLIGLGAHAHGSWSFARPGRYRLTMTHRATVDGVPQQDTRALEVLVDGAPDADPPPPGTPHPAPEAPGPAPAPGAATPAAGRGTVVIRSTVGRLTRRRLVAVRLGCTAATACRGTLRLRTAARIRHGRTARVLVLGSARVAVPAGRAATVRVRVPAGVARSLRAGRRARPVVRATVSGDGRGGVVRRLRVGVR